MPRYSDQMGPCEVGKLHGHAQFRVEEAFESRNAQGFELPLFLQHSKSIFPD